MTGKKFLVGGAFAGVFLLGAMFSPIGEPAANEDAQGAGLSYQVVQTADNSTETQNQETEGYICPNTGEQMGRGQGMGNGAAVGAQFLMTMPELIADALGLTMDELQTATSEGKSVADLAGEKGIAVEELVAKMVEARKVELEQLVKDGTLTQTQMKTMLANMEAMMENAVERGMVGPMNGRGGGPGKCMGQGQTNNEASPTNQSL
ncbi:hypothetical protein [Mesobacillus maritimus]|uniref:hypothetical protein n=1 Tax=Mesobacillus maritimus TaxID=1643336 RepID=UPI00384E59BB